MSINAPAELHTHGAFVVLGGVAALPAGSVRLTGGGCQPGTFAIVWTNTTNGSRGRVFVSWNCPADALDWRSDQIPLAPGTTVEEAERRLIIMTLEHTRNNKTRAAEILGISLKTLHNKLNRLRLRPNRGGEP